MLEAQALIILSLAEVCRDEHNLDCLFELEEQVMLAVGSCSCSQMTTDSLTIGLRLLGAFEAGCQGVGYMLLFAASLLVGFTCWRSDDNRLADEHFSQYQLM